MNVFCCSILLISHINCLQSSSLKAPKVFCRRESAWTRDTAVFKFTVSKSFRFMFLCYWFPEGEIWFGVGVSCKYKHDTKKGYYRKCTTHSVHAALHRLHIQFMLINLMELLLRLFLQEGNPKPLPRLQQLMFRAERRRRVGCGFSSLFDCRLFKGRRSGHPQNFRTHALRICVYSFYSQVSKPIYSSISQVLYSSVECHHNIFTDPKHSPSLEETQTMMYFCTHSCHVFMPAHLLFHLHSQILIGGNLFCIS